METDPKEYSNLRDTKTGIHMVKESGPDQLSIYKS